MYLPQAGAVSIFFYDLNGLLKDQVNRKFPTAGNQNLEWNVSTWPRGMYIVKLISGKQIVTSKMVVSN
jgi:hypothetical protein